MIIDELNKLMESHPLSDIERGLTDELGHIDSDGNDVKLCLMLAMLAEQSIARLGRIDREAFPEQIRKRAQELLDTHRQRLEELIRHQRENARIMESITAAEAELRPRLDAIGEELRQTDRMLRSHVVTNDNSQVSAL